jgi:hypothetical protein
MDYAPVEKNVKEVTRVTDISVDILEIAKEQERIVKNILARISGFTDDGQDAKGPQAECLTGILQTAKKLQEENLKKMYEILERL